MPQLNSVTSGPIAAFHTVHHAIDGGQHVVSSLFDDLAELFSPVGHTSGSDVSPASNDGIGRSALAEAAPEILMSMRDLVRHHPEGARGTRHLVVGNERIAVSEGHDGVEIMDEASGKCSTLPVANFAGFVHALAAEIDRHPEHYGEEAIHLAREVTVHTLLGTAPEIRRAFTDFLDGESSASLLCASSLAAGDPKLEARALGFAGSQLMKRDGLQGLRTALENIADLPHQYRLTPMQALVKAIPSMKVDDGRAPSGADPEEKKLVALLALSDAACALTPQEQYSLFVTMIPVASELNEYHCAQAWHFCFERVLANNDIEPGDRGSALTAFADSYVLCLADPADKVRHFARIHSAVKELGTAEPSKGEALVGLANTIGFLPLRNQQAALEAILPDVIALDDNNPSKGLALNALANRAGASSPASFKAILGAVLGLAPAAPGKGAALANLVPSMEDQYATDAATFTAVIQALEALDGATALKQRALTTLARRIETLPAANQLAAFQAVYQAVRTIDGPTSNPDQAIHALLGVAPNLPSADSGIAFAAIIPALQEMYMKASGMSKNILEMQIADAICLLPEAHHDAANEAFAQLTETK